MGPGVGRSSIKVSIRTLNQPRDGVDAISAFALRTKLVKRRQRAGWTEVENRATATKETAAASSSTNTTLGCGPVEVPIRTLDQSRLGLRAVRTTGFGAKTVQRGQHTGWCDLVNCSVVAGPAKIG